MRIYESGDRISGCAVVQLTRETTPSSLARALVLGRLGGDSEAPISVVVVQLLRAVVQGIHAQARLTLKTPFAVIALASAEHGNVAFELNRSSDDDHLPGP
jgi:hypothetical protein